MKPIKNIEEFAKILEEAEKLHDGLDGVSIPLLKTAIKKVKNVE